MFGRAPPAPIDYYSVLEDEEHWTKEQYALQVTNPAVWTQIQFTIDMNLVLHTAKEQTVLDIFAWFGGWFAFLYVFAYAFMRIIVPKVQQISLILRLFQMDPNKGKTPRDPLLEEKATSAELIKMAKQKVKARRQLPRSTEEVFMRVSDHFFQTIFYCCKRRTGVEASLLQAERMVSREMDVYNFLKNSRQTDASIHALTTFEQRRLINQ